MFNKLLQSLLVAAVLAWLSNPASADILFESGMLGPTGVSFNDLGGVVPGTNIQGVVFAGVRFELAQPVMTTAVGGHFVAPNTGTFFGAIIALDDANDFPNSEDLSTSDVLGHTLLTFPTSSAEVYGNLELRLDPGWYGLVFGSGLFGATTDGGAVRNGTDIGDPSYIAFGPNLKWFNLDIFQDFFDNHRFVVTGNIVPEPSSLSLLFTSMYLLGRSKLAV
jgi:hypothetical protein